MPTPYTPPPTTRAGKDAPLTHNEVDQNWLNQHAGKAEKADLEALDERVTVAEGALANKAAIDHGHTAAEIPVGASSTTTVQEALAELDAEQQGLDARITDAEADLAALQDQALRDKGYYPTPEALISAHPVAQEGDWAFVDSTNSEWFWSDGAWIDSGKQGAVSSVNGLTGDVALAARDIPFAPPPDALSTDVQAAIEELFARPGAVVDVFLTSGTWTKRPGAKVVEGMVIGGGAGGASGSVNVDAQLAQGGGGGGGAARTEFTLDATAAPASCAVTVGIGGHGGAASAGGFNNGSAGGTSSIYVGSALYRALGGNAGVGPSGPSGADGLFPGGVGGAGGSATNRNGSSGRGSVTTGVSAGGGGPGGGGGGALLASNLEGQGGAAAFSTVYAGSAAVPGGSGGAIGGGHGLDAATSGSYSAYLYPGVSGGGGGANQSGDGGNGGNASGYGAGGGGGGAARTGFMSGRGGNGSPGVVILITYF